MSAQILSGRTVTNHCSIAGGEMPCPISWEVICSRFRHVLRAASHYLQLIVGDTVRRPPSSQIRASSCIAKIWCDYTDPGNRERERKRMPGINMKDFCLQMRSECWKREATKRRERARGTLIARADLVEEQKDHIVSAISFNNTGRLQRFTWQ